MNGRAGGRKATLNRGRSRGLLLLGLVVPWGCLCHKRRYSLYEYG